DKMTMPPVYLIDEKMTTSEKAKLPYRFILSYSERITRLEKLRLKSSQLYQRASKGEPGTDWAEVMYWEFIKTCEPVAILSDFHNRDAQAMAADMQDIELNPLAPAAFQKHMKRIRSLMGRYQKMQSDYDSEMAEMQSGMGKVGETAKSAPGTPGPSRFRASSSMPLRKWPGRPGKGTEGDDVPAKPHPPSRSFEQIIRERRQKLQSQNLLELLGNDRSENTKSPEGESGKLPQESLAAHQSRGLSSIPLNEWCRPGKGTKGDDVPAKPPPPSRSFEQIRRERLQKLRSQNLLELPGNNQSENSKSPKDQQVDSLFSTLTEQERREKRFNDWESSYKQCQAPRNAMTPPTAPLALGGGTLNKSLDKSSKSPIEQKVDSFARPSTFLKVQPILSKNGDAPKVHCGTRRITMPQATAPPALNGGTMNMSLGKSSKSAVDQSIASTVKAVTHPDTHPTVSEKLENLPEQYSIGKIVMTSTVTPVPLPLHGGVMNKSLDTTLKSAIEPKEDLLAEPSTNLKPQAKHSSELEASAEQPIMIPATAHFALKEAFMSKMRGRLEKAADPSIKPSFRSIPAFDPLALSYDSKTSNPVTPSHSRVPSLASAGTTSKDSAKSSPQPAEELVDIDMENEESSKLRERALTKERLDEAKNGWNVVEGPDRGTEGMDVAVSNMKDVTRNSKSESGEDIDGEDWDFCG
ncbi:MAG: hypothetical protein Q9169_007110, partial [Polycauliona sp. 2 TL-2023]